jgi:hypothetical protein
MWTRIAVVVLAGALMFLPAELLSNGQYELLTGLGLLVVFVAFAVESRLGRFGKPLSMPALLITAVLASGAFWLATSGPLILTRQLNLLAVMGAVLGGTYLWKRRQKADAGT